MQTACGWASLVKATGHLSLQGLLAVCGEGRSQFSHLLLSGWGLPSGPGPPLPSCWVAGSSSWGLSDQKEAGGAVGVRGSAQVGSQVETPPTHALLMLVTLPSLL